MKRGPAPATRGWRIVSSIARRVGALFAFGLTGLAVLAIASITSRHQLAQPSDVRFPIRGIDVSHHQGVIDWASVSKSNIRFAFIKASEGADHLDTRFVANWKHSAESGLQRGAYHFFTFCSPGAAQARHFIRAVPPGERMLPPAVDVEYSGNCANPPPNDVILRELRILLEALAVHFGRPPIVYTTNEVRVRLLRGALHEYPLWIRNVYAPPWSLGATGWTFWQHDDEGVLAGVATPVDLNVFHGDARAFTLCVEQGRCVPGVEATN